MRDFLRVRHVPIVSGVLVALLLAKYGWTLFAFDLPLGYDTGIYRYLFLKHAASFPPFSVESLDPWARGHPLGLFFLTSALIKIGVPVDAFLGWVWNLEPVILACVLAWVMFLREGRAVGTLTLLFAVLSVAQFDAFLGMYWKTIVALVWTVLTFHFLERRSRFAVFTGVLALVTHHQTGLLLVLTVLLSSSLPLFTQRRKIPRSMMLGSLLTLALAGMIYLPVFQGAVLEHVRALLRPGQAPAGSFPSADFFIAHEGILLAMGMSGLFLSFRTERGSVWQCAAGLSLLLILIRFFFYKRFFLQFEFFLLPFAAHALSSAWSAFRLPVERSAIVLLLVVQSMATLGNVAPKAFPLWCRALPSVCAKYPVPPVATEIDRKEFEAVLTLEDSIPRGAFVLALDPVSAPWVRGWLPDRNVAGPGVFSSPWDIGGWERFLLGSNEDRERLLEPLPKPLYLFVSSVFRAHYGSSVDAFLRDPCFHETSHSSILLVECP